MHCNEWPFLAVSIERFARFEAASPGICVAISAQAFEIISQALVSRHKTLIPAISITILPLVSPMYGLGQKRKCHVKCPICHLKSACRLGTLENESLVHTVINVIRVCDGKRPQNERINSESTCVRLYLVA